MNKDPLPVRVPILRVIYKAMLPIKTRMDALLKSYYNKEILLSQAEFTALLEFRSAASTVELMVEDYLEQAEEAEVSVLYLPAPEFNLLLDLSKTSELATRTPFARSGLWTH